MKNRTRTITVSDRTEQMLANVADLHPLVTKHKIARTALQLGLTQLAADPSGLVEAARAEGAEGPTYRSNSELAARE